MTDPLDACDGLADRPAARAEAALADARRADWRAFMQRQRDSFKLGLLKYAPLYLAASAPVELIDGEIAEQMDYICNIAKEVIDIARNLSFIHGDLHTVYAHTIYTGYNA